MLISDTLQQNTINSTEVKIFLSHILGKDRSFFTAFPEFKLSERQSSKLKQFIKRRAQGEPLAYILGFQEFYSLKLKVDKRVMIPRPETEELVNQVIKEVYALHNSNKKSYGKVGQIKIVDVGTGSGNIAISLAYVLPLAKIYAVEKDKNAFNLARSNIAAHKLRKRITLLYGRLLDPIRQLAERVDLVVANLPYIPRQRIATLQSEIRDWEPRVSLDGGVDGLELYRELFIQAKNIIKPGGSIH